MIHGLDLGFTLLGMLVALFGFRSRGSLDSDSGHCDVSLSGAAALGLACAFACCLALGAGADALRFAGSACLYLH